MRCSVKDILKRDGEVAEISGILEYDKLENNGDEIKFTTPISFSGEMKNDSGIIFVTGEVEFNYSSFCHRCGKIFSDNLTFNVSEEFSESPIEEQYLLKGDTLDLEEMLINNIRLNLPVKLLCSPECKGICSTCGTDLNANKCNCTENNINPSFSVLTDLLK